MADPNIPSIEPNQPLREHTEDSQTPRPVVVARVAMPEVVPGAVIATFDVRPDPAFPPVKTANTPRVGQGKSFTQDPTKGVLVFEMQVSEVNEANNVPFSPKFEMYVLRETFVEMALDGEKLLSQARLNGVNQIEVETLHWRDWGVSGARFHDATMERRNWVSTYLDRMGNPLV